MTIAISCVNMASHRCEVKETFYVIQVRDCEDEWLFLRESRGDWGPSHYTVNLIEEADRFGSAKHAQRHWELHRNAIGYDNRVRFVRVNGTFTYRWSV